MKFSHIKISVSALLPVANAVKKNIYSGMSHVWNKQSSGKKTNNTT